MMKPPTQTVPQDAATFAFYLLDQVVDYLDHNDPKYSRVSLAMQMLNGSLTVAQALDYASDITDAG